MRLEAPHHQISDGTGASGKQHGYEYNLSRKSTPLDRPPCIPRTSLRRVTETLSYASMAADLDKRISLK